jgi:nucleotide-binding universal stress UspA family protein
MRANEALRINDIAPSLSVLKVRRVLHPTDLKPTSNQALSMAIALAQQNGADLVLMHALPPPTPLYESDSPYRTEAEEDLAMLAQRVSQLGIVVKRVLVKGTNPVPRSIARCAKFFKADVIVIGTGARTGIARFLAGSMTAKVIGAAPCPVLVVKN